MLDSVPSTSYSEVTLARQYLASDAQERDGESNIATGSWCDETCRLHIRLLYAPVGRERLFVTRTARVEHLVRERKLECSTLWQRCFSQSLEAHPGVNARCEHEAGLTQVLPFDRNSLAVDADIAGTSWVDAAAACTPRRSVRNMSFILNIMMAE